MILATVSSLNLEYQHINGKIGKHFPNDWSSHNPASYQDPSHCSVCKFVADCTSIDISEVSLKVTDYCIIGSINPSDTDLFIKDIISGRTSLPLNNKFVIKCLQDQDLQRVRQLLLAGQTLSSK